MIRLCGETTGITSFSSPKGWESINTHQNSKFSVIARCYARRQMVGRHFVSLQDCYPTPSPASKKDYKLNVIARRENAFCIRFCGAIPDVAIHFGDVKYTGFPPYIYPLKMTWHIWCTTTSLAQVDCFASLAMTHKLK